MNRDDFLNALSERLRNLPEAERERLRAYYDEMIGDRIEEGMSEEAAVAALGDIEEIVSGIMYDMPIGTLIKAKVNSGKRKAKGGYLPLVILGAPLWLPLLLAFAATVFAIYVAIWSVIVALYAVLVALGFSFAGGVIAGAVTAFTRDFFVGLCLIGMAVVCAGLLMLLLRPLTGATKALVRLTVRFARFLKSLVIVKKED